MPIRLVNQLIQAQRLTKSIEVHQGSPGVFQV